MKQTRRSVFIVQALHARALVIGDSGHVRAQDSISVVLYTRKNGFQCKSCAFVEDQDLLVVTSISLPLTMTQDSSLGRTTRKVEIEDERKNNLLSIMVRASL